MTKEIKLSQGYVALVDDEDYEWLNQWKWSATRDGHLGNYYANRKESVKDKRIKISMHRLIMNTPKNLVVDHINHNTLDNRKENLRNVTTQENLQNRRLHRKGRACGIHLHEGYWRAQFSFFGKVFQKQSKDINVVAKWINEKRTEVKNN